MKEAIPNNQNIAEQAKKIPTLFQEFLELSALAPHQITKEIQISWNEPTCYGGYFDVSPQQQLPEIYGEYSKYTIFIGRTTEDPNDENCRVVVEIIDQQYKNSRHKKMPEGSRDVYILTIGNAGKLRPYRSREWMEDGWERALMVLPVVRDEIYKKHKDIAKKIRTLMEDKNQPTATG